MIRKIEKAFEISAKDLRKLMKDFRNEMERGLAGKESSLAMIPTYVMLPTGKEKGNFLALDLGGTHFRVLKLELKGNGRISSLKAMKFTVDKKHMTGSGAGLFGFIAGCIKVFLEKEKIPASKKREMGFTFSFPVNQTGIASGRLIRWTKGFGANGVIGEDVVGLLEEALAGKGIFNIRVAALANDTVGTLESGRYSDKHCDVGVILGTGTNACYPEKDGMVVNIEWGNFDKLKRTVYDKALDRNSTNPGMQVMEKMVSGMYLGPLAWSVIKDVTGCRGSGEFTTEHMSVIEGDGSHDLRRAGSLLRQLGIKSGSLKKRHVARRICQIVTLRAARISGACIAAIVTKMDPALSQRHTIAVDGSVYEKHPTFAKEVSSCLEEIFGSRSGRINLTMAKDGSGIGAAVIAAVASSHTRSYR